MNKAFTLIELLVVVLIIGILAAIALPQYEKAVEKSRFTQYQTMGSGLVQAAKLAYMENGNWPTSFDDLAVQLPADMNIQVEDSIGVCKKNSQMYCCMAFPNSSANRTGSIRCGDNEYHLVYVRAFASPTGVPGASLTVNCAAKEEKYKSICKAISGTTAVSSTAGVFTPDGWKDGYSYYVLRQ